MSERTSIKPPFLVVEEAFRELPPMIGYVSPPDGPRIRGLLTHQAMCNCNKRDNGV